MASQRHRTAAKHSADGTKRADKWHEDRIPLQRLRAFASDVESVRRFTDTDLEVDREYHRGNYQSLILTTHDRILSPGLMSVLVEYDAVIELLESHGRWNKSTWAVALPVRD